jgi:hypothetical protein
MVYRRLSIFTGNSQVQCLEIFDMEFMWNWWYVVAQLVEALRHKLEGCGFQFDS